MKLQDAIEFINKTKQPAAYFDTDTDRYRFQNLIIENDQRIYKYLNTKDHNIEIRLS